MQSVRKTDLIRATLILEGRALNAQRKELTCSQILIYGICISSERAQEKAQEKAIRLALDFPIRIVTPFMRKTKAEEWALAAKLGVFDLIANGTVTCYNGIPGKGCGKCPACKLRNRGLREYERSLRGR